MHTRETFIICKNLLLCSFKADCSLSTKRFIFRKLLQSVQGAHMEVAHHTQSPSFKTVATLAEAILSFLWALRHLNFSIGKCHCLLRGTTVLNCNISTITIILFSTASTTHNGCRHDAWSRFWVFCMVLDYVLRMQHCLKYRWIHLLKCVALLNRKLDVSSIFFFSVK